MVSRIVLLIHSVDLLHPIAINGGSYIHYDTDNTSLRIHGSSKSFYANKCTIRASSHQTQRYSHIESIGTSTYTKALIIVRIVQMALSLKCLLQGTVTEAD